MGDAYRDRMRAELQRCIDDNLTAQGEAVREGEAEALGEYDRPHSFYVQTDDGLTMHINGDPRMSDEALAAITEVCRLAMAMYERGELPHQRRKE